MNHFSNKLFLGKVQSKNLKLAASLLLFLGAITSVYSQGTVSGVVTDAATKETLIGASILVQGSTKGTITDIDGNYSLTDVDAGTYTLVIQSMSYDKKVIPNVVVKNGQNTPLNIEMAEASFALENVVVVAKANRESENILLMEQKEAVVAKQAVGAKEMSRKGISDAEGAVAQVTGVSKQEGVKNVFVRGLGDRYNATTLNGFPIPSEDPEYKNISLDFFGSDVIQNVGINKVFTAGSSNDVGGALIDISSKELVDEKELSFDASAGLNDRTMNSDFLKADGVDYFGFANTTQPGDDAKTSYGYGNKLDPSSVSMPVNYSYGFSVGKKYKLGANADPLSFFLVGSYSTGYSYTKDNRIKTITSMASDFLEGYKSSININQLVLGNITYLLKKKHELSYNLLVVHDNNQYVGQYIGTGSSFESGESYDGYYIRQQTNDNLLITNQLISKFKLSEKLDLDAGVSYNRVTGTEPDTRDNKLSEDEITGEYSPMRSENNTIRSFSELIEDDINTRLLFDYALPEKFKDDKSALHVGYIGRYVFDDFSANQYSYLSSFSATQTMDELLLDTWFNQESLDAKDFTLAFNRESWYTVNKYINSGSASVDYQFTPRLTANAGLSMDMVNMHIEYEIRGADPEDNSLVKNYFLPSFNAKYSLTDKHALRVGLSKTYTLPQSKEISPYLYIGPDYSSVGNPDLQPSDNYNADLKWDYYISASELFSVTGFYKYIKDPIALTYENSAGGYYTYNNVSDFATVAGVELEVRKNIFNKTNSSEKKENKLSAGLNASYIYSNMTVKVNGTSSLDNLVKDCQLEGASPLLANVDLSYNYSKKEMSFTNSLVLSYYSDRIYSIGLMGFEDTIEKGSPSLNFVSISELNKHFSIKIKAKNLLDPEHQLTRKLESGENVVLDSYYKGIDVSLGIGYKF